MAVAEPYRGRAVGRAEIDGVGRASPLSGLVEEHRSAVRREVDRPRPVVPREVPLTVGSRRQSDDSLLRASRATRTRPSREMSWSVSAPGARRTRRLRPERFTAWSARCRLRRPP